MSFSFNLFSIQFESCQNSCMHISRKPCVELKYTKVFRLFGSVLLLRLSVLYSLPVSSSLHCPVCVVIYCQRCSWGLVANKVIVNTSFLSFGVRFYLEAPWQCIVVYFGSFYTSCSFYEQDLFRFYFCFPHIAGHYAPGPDVPGLKWCRSSFPRLLIISFFSKTFAAHASRAHRLLVKLS